MAVSTAEVFSRILEPHRPGLSAAAARSLLRLDFPPRDRERMNTLAEKARQGTLTAEDDQELNSYIEAGHLLAIIQSKARRSLRKATARS